MNVDRKAQAVIMHYDNILDDAAMTDAEKAGYLHAASSIDPRLEQLTIEQAREIVDQLVTRREVKQ